ncbi:hypothetical protein BCR44DRAFT_1431103, partial [Catenaria anguillulae PL171]
MDSLLNVLFTVNDDIPYPIIVAVLGVMTSTTTNTCDLLGRYGRVLPTDYMVATHQ